MEIEYAKVFRMERKRKNAVEGNVNLYILAFFMLSIDCHRDVCVCVENQE